MNTYLAHRGRMPATVLQTCVDPYLRWYLYTQPIDGGLVGHNASAKTLVARLNQLTLVVLVLSPASDGFEELCRSFGSEVLSVAHGYNW